MEFARMLPLEHTLVHVNKDVAHLCTCTKRKWSCGTAQPFREYDLLSHESFLRETFHSTERRRLNSWVWRRREWKRNVFYIIYVQQSWWMICLAHASLPDLCFISESCSPALSLSLCTHVSVMYSVNSICSSFFPDFLLAFLHSCNFTLWWEQHVDE